MSMNFSSARWLGRLIGMLVDIAYRRGVRFSSTGEVTLLILLAEVSPVLTPEEKDIVHALMNKASECKAADDANGISYTDDQIIQMRTEGQHEAMIVIRDNPDYSKLLTQEDFYGAEQARQMVEKEKQKKKRLYVFGAIAAVVLAIVIYNLPFFKENRAYREAVASEYEWVWHTYYQEFPNGRHYGEVLYHEIQHVGRPVEQLIQYMDKFPLGKYYSDCELKYNALWNEELEKYENRDKKGEDPEAVAYVSEMLKYMRDNRIHTIMVATNPSIVLKDYDDYSDMIKLLLPYMYGSSSSLKMPEDVLSLKENFTQGDQDFLAEILSDGIKRSLLKTFAVDLIDVVVNENEADPDSPLITFDYVIKNQEISDFPEIWTYTENNIPTKYLLGISIDFVANFTIPGSDVSYVYEASGEPIGEINGIKNIADGYRRMTQMCFAKVSNQMSVTLGLEQTYFSGE